MIYWHEWWVWAAAGMLLGIAEIVLPGYFFLGLSAGAFVLAAGIPVAQALGIALPGLTALLAISAVVSLLAWLAMRIYFKPPGRQVKIWRRDINKN